MRTFKAIAKLSLLFVTGLNLLPQAQGGDRFHGYDAFAGKWRAKNCSEIPGLAISLTESRSNAINVYKIDSKARRTLLRISTSPMLATKGELRRISDRFDKGELQVEAMAQGERRVIVFIRVDSDGLLRYRESSALESDKASGLLDCILRRW